MPDGNGSGRRSSSLAHGDESLRENLTITLDWSRLRREFIGQTAAATRIGKSGWGRRATEEADWANVILCRPFRDSILSLTYPALPCRALNCSVPTGLVALLR